MKYTEGETGYPTMLQYRHFNKLLVEQNIVDMRKYLIPQFSVQSDDLKRHLHAASSDRHSSMNKNGTTFS